MTLQQLIDLFWVRATDTLQPHMFAAEDVAELLTEAQEQAAARADLLHERTDPAITRIAVVAERTEYPLHAKVLRVTHASFLATDSESNPVPLTIIDRTELDRIQYDWRWLTSQAEPRWLLVEEGKCTIVPPPSTAGRLQMEVYRLPKLALESDTDVPEIAEVHHRHLVDRALARGFDRPDRDYYDAKRAAAAEAEFTDHFGPERDADHWRAAEEVPHFVKAWP